MPVSCILFLEQNLIFFSTLIVAIRGDYFQFCNHCDANFQNVHSHFCPRVTYPKLIKSKLRGNLWRVWSMSISIVTGGLYWSSSDNRSPQISWSLLCILVDLSSFDGWHLFQFLFQELRNCSKDSNYDYFGLVWFGLDRLNGI